MCKHVLKISFCLESLERNFQPHNLLFVRSNGFFVRSTLLSNKYLVLDKQTREISFSLNHDRELDLRANITNYLCVALNSRFDLNQISGEIKTARALDRETADFHQFTVVASLHFLNGSYNSHAEVLVTVEDINDNPPVLAKEEYTISLSLHAKPGLLLNLNVSINLGRVTTEVASVLGLMVLVNLKSFL